MQRLTNLYFQILRRSSNRVHRAAPAYSVHIDFYLSYITGHRCIISTRHQGETLFPITTWPASVYVARILDENVSEARTFKREQVELIAWAMIFSTRDQAAVQADKLAQ